MNVRVTIALACAAAVWSGAVFGSHAAACSPPPVGHSVSPDIPDQIPKRGSLPVVFYGNAETRTVPLESPNVTFQVQNSSGKRLNGSAETYIIGKKKIEYFELRDFLVAWRPAEGWKAGEIYTLFVKTEHEYRPEDNRDIEHPFTVVDTSMDVAEPTIQSAYIEMRESPDTQDCCEIDRANTCEISRRCWATSFRYFPMLMVQFDPVPDDIWAAQTLYTSADTPALPQYLPDTLAPDPFQVPFTQDDTSFCTTPTAIRIADGSRIEADDVCLGVEDIPEYDERDASEVVDPPDNCKDSGGVDSGGDAGMDAGQRDGETVGDAYDDADSQLPDATEGTDTGSTDVEGTNADAGSDDEMGTVEDGCGCSSHSRTCPASELVLGLFLIAAVRLRRAATRD